MARMQLRQQGLTTGFWMLTARLIYGGSCQFMAQGTWGRDPTLAPGGSSGKLKGGCLLGGGGGFFRKIATRRRRRSYKAAMAYPGGLHALGNICSVSGGGGGGWRVSGGGSAVGGGVPNVGGGSPRWGGLRVTHDNHMHTSRGDVCLGRLWGSFWPLL